MGTTPQTLLPQEVWGMRENCVLRMTPFLASLTSSMNNNKEDFSQPVLRIMNIQRGKEAFLRPHSPSGWGRFRGYMRAGFPGVQEFHIDVSEEATGTQWQGLVVQHPPAVVMDSVCVPSHPRLSKTMRVLAISASFSPCLSCRAQPRRPQSIWEKVGYQLLCLLAVCPWVGRCLSLSQSEEKWPCVGCLPRAKHFYNLISF